MFLEGGVRANGTIRMELTDEKTAVVLGQDYQVLENEISGNGSASGDMNGIPVRGNWTMNGTEYWDVLSLKRVFTSTTISLEGGINPGFGFVNFTMSVTSRTKNKILSDEWSYPFEAGHNGTVQVERHYNQTTVISIQGLPDNTSSVNQQGTVFVQYECVHEEALVIPAGEFQTFTLKISEEDNSYEMNYYSPKAGAGVRVLRYDPKGEEIGDWELKSYSYAGSQKSSDNTVVIYLMTSLIIVVLAAVFITLIVKRRARKA